MKTIFDKVDPKYLECSTGACEHVSHMFNGSALICCSVLLLYIAYIKLQPR